MVGEQLVCEVGPVVVVELLAVQGSGHGPPAKVILCEFKALFKQQ